MLGTQALLEAAHGGRGALPPRLHLRGLRRPRRSTTDEIVHRGLALPAADAVQRVEGGRRPLRCAPYHETFGAADHDHELLEQLRAVPVPGEGHPGLHDQRARRHAAPAVRVHRRTSASGSTCSTTAPAIELVDHDGHAPARPTTSAAGVEASIEEIADLAARPTGKPRVAEDDRPRPARSRPPLPARLHEDPPRAGLGAADRAGTRAPGHGRVVPREPRLVGAAEGARTRLRDGLALISR